MGDHKEHGINIDPGYIRELAEMLDATGLSEIEVEDGERKIRVARTMTAVAAPVAMAAAAAPVAATPAASAPVSTAADTMTGATKSPMVGTVYLSPEPGAAPYAAVGSAITAGDTILIIEAMKVMNPITATSSGTLKAVHVENSQPVEFDQPLFTIA